MGGRVSREATPLFMEFLWCSKCRKETLAICDGSIAVTVGGLQCGGPYTIREKLPLNRGRLAEVLCQFGEQPDQGPEKQ